MILILQPGLIKIPYTLMRNLLSWTILKAVILPFLTDKNGIFIWFNLIVGLTKTVKYKVVNRFFIFKFKETWI